jgi:hypothetical protein
MHPQRSNIASTLDCHEHRLFCPDEGPSARILEPLPFQHQSHHRRARSLSLLSHTRRPHRLASRTARSRARLAPRLLIMSDKRRQFAHTGTRRADPCCQPWQTLQTPRPAPPSDSKMRASKRTTNNSPTIPAPYPSTHSSSSPWNTLCPKCGNAFVSLSTAAVDLDTDGAGGYTGSMKSLYAFLLLALTGCASVRYSQYIGDQPENPTSTGAFVRQVKGVPIYQGYPSRPYDIMGRFEISGDPDAADAQLAWLAKEKKADAVLFQNKDRIASGSASTHVGNSSGGLSFGSSFSEPLENVELTGLLIKWKVQTSEPKASP